MTMGLLLPIYQFSTIYTSKLKHLVLSVMGFEREKKWKTSRFPICFDQESLTPNMSLGTILQHSISDTIKR